MSKPRKRRPISPLEFVLICVIVGLVALVGLQVLLGQLADRSAHPALPVAAQIAPTATHTLEPTATASPTPLVSNTPTLGVTQDLPPTWTPTPTWTASPTKTPTPTSSNTPTPTSKPPLPGLRPTVTISATDLVSGTEFLSEPAGPPTPVPLLDLPGNTVNIALLGSDKRPDSAGWRTDVIIVASINPDIPAVNMFSIPRDTWVYIPNWRYTRINLADSHGEAINFPGGGPGLVAQTLQYDFGIPVQYYARVDFDGFKKLIDSVDGVDVVADCPLYDIFPDNPPGVTDIGYTEVTGTIDIPAAGVYHLDGKHALWYARSRKTTSDFDRSRRQQRVLRALWNKVQQQGIINQLPNLWGDLLNTVQTDLSLNDVLYLANLGLQIDRSRIKNSFLDGEYAHRFVSQEGASVFYFNYDEISDTLKTAFTPLDTNRAGQPSASIEVLNGTGHADWEAVGADRLNWAGYRVTTTGPADRSDYPSTLIYDLRSTTKGSRLSELGRLFDVPRSNLISQPDSTAGAEYRIILGADWNPCQRAAIGVFPTRTPTPAPTPE
jgi:LCP family protein required for cell wall assembly